MAKSGDMTLEEYVARAITKGRIEECVWLSEEHRIEQLETFWRSYLTDALHAIAAVREYHAHIPKPDTPPQAASGDVSSR